MKPNPIPARLLVRSGLAILFSLASVAGVLATDLESVMNAGAQSIQIAQAAQQTIDEVVRQTESLETEYKQVMKQLDGLAVYNAYMERQTTAQDAELADLHQSIEQIGSVERQIMPLMMRMFDSLTQFIDLDMAFLEQERVERVERLRALMERSDVSVAEKFRRLTEAYQIENDFGRTIETYKNTIVIEGSTLEVNVLRLGRIGLYYQTNDASATGLWNRQTRQWEPLSGSNARNQIRRGIRIARKLVAPDLLLLDIPAPEVTP